MSEVVRKQQGRPAFIQHDGWTIALSVHDAAYTERMREWKRRLREAHPDKGKRKSSAEFRRLVKERDTWRRGEAAWYAALGLLPPDGTKIAQAKLSRTLRLRTRVVVVEPPGVVADEVGEVVLEVIKAQEEEKASVGGKS